MVAHAPICFFARSLCTTAAVGSQWQASWPFASQFMNGIRQSLASIRLFRVVATPCLPPVLNDVALLTLAICRTIRDVLVLADRC